MIRKQCTKCKKTKPLQDFALKNSNRGIYHSECKACHKLIRADYYNRFKQKEITRITQRKKEIYD